MRGFDWKWVAIGAVIMLALSFVGGLVASLFWGEELQEAAAGEAEAALDGGQLFVLALISFLAFAIGGFIVGVRSAGRTILEPAVAAAIAVAIGLLLAGNFTLGNLLFGALVPFLAGMLGGYLGERRQAGRQAV